LEKRKTKKVKGGGLQGGGAGEALWGGVFCGEWSLYELISGVVKRRVKKETVKYG